MNDFTAKIHNYLIRNRTIIIYSFLFAVIAYGYELFNFSLSIDEEGYLFKNATEEMHWIRLGRWGTYLINIALFPHSLLPFLPTLISICCIAFASVLFVNSEEGDLQSKIIFSLIFISYPLHSYYIAFSTLSASLGIGVVLSVLGFLLVKESLKDSTQKIILILAAIVALTISMSTYQGIFPVFLILILTHLFLKLLNDPDAKVKDLLRCLIRFLIVFVSAYILYFIADRIFKFALLDPSYKQNPQYFDHFIGWGNQPIKKVILNLINYTKGYLWGDIFYGMNSIRSIFFLIPILLFVIFKKVKSIQNRIFSLLLLGLLLLTPFFVMYLIGSNLPPRSLEALPFLMAIIWWLVSQNVRVGLRMFFLVVAIMIFVNNTFHTTRLFHTANVTWQADRVMAGRIIERVYHLDLPTEMEKIPIAFVGSFRYEENELFIKTRDVFGASYFEWNRGQGCIRNLYKSMGINEIKLVPAHIIHGYSETIDTMEAWPNKNSIILKDDIVIVKLNESRNRKKFKKEKKLKQQNQ
jgi:hypothetical protein